MELPEGLTPEAAAWIEAQMVIANARTIAKMRAEVEKVDDWANGVFVALRDVVHQLLTLNPALGAKLAPTWRTAAEAFDRIELHGLPAQAGEPLELLEARKMLYRLFLMLGLMPEAEAVPVRRAA